MAISNAPSQVATSALQAIPFSSMIGGPLKAAIDAQAMAARTSWEFIKEVGLNTDPKTGKKEAVQVSFNFIQNGREAQLNVPLLTIVPIPYIAIHTIDINFKASLSASSSSYSEQSESSNLTAGAEVNAGLKIGPFHMDAKLKANYSSKKDSKATEESKYSVEYTMDVAVKAGQDSMPAGMAKVLELLGNSLDVTDPDGELNVNQTEFLLEKGDEKAQLLVTYKNAKGIYDPGQIEVKKGDKKEEPVANNNETSRLYQLEEGEYTIKANNSKKEIKIVVKKVEKTDGKIATEEKSSH